MFTKGVIVGVVGTLVVIALIILLLMRFGKGLIEASAEIIVNAIWR